MKSTKIKLAHQHIKDHRDTWDDRTPDYTAVEDAFIAGWDARKQADEDLLMAVSCGCLKRLDEVE